MTHRLLFLTVACLVAAPVSAQTPTAPAGAASGPVVRTYVMPPPPPRHAAPADEPVQCLNGKTDALTGSAAPAGRRYAVAVGMSIAVPSAPDDWKLVRCNSTQVFLMHQDQPSHDVVTAMAAFVSVPWHDEASYRDEVVRVVAAKTGPGEHLRNNAVKMTTVDGRPCVDILRSGDVAPMTIPDGGSTPPMVTREHVRACHLRDARGPEAAVITVIKEVALQDPARFDAMADPFIDGMRLPAWMR